MRPIDTHAHVFTAACPLAPDRRYTPAYEAPLTDYLAALDRAGVGQGVLVQPSFLGTDNGYLAEALGTAGGRLKGVAVVSPDIADRALDALGDAHVVGIRLNLIGRDPLEVTTPAYRHLCRRVAARGWLIQVQADGRDLAVVLPTLTAVGAPLVIDHFGRPDPRLGVDDPGFRALAARASERRIWVKLSAPYRCGAADMRPHARTLLHTFGPDRLLWGSDWPWTQHEAGQSYAQTRDWLGAWVPDETARRTIETASPRRLFGFD